MLMDDDGLLNDRIFESPIDSTKNGSPILLLMDLSIKNVSS